MPDPITLTVTASFVGIALGQWLTGKTAEAAWHALRDCLKPDTLRVRIESALKSDTAVAKAYHTRPTLDRTQLTEQSACELLRVTLSNDLSAVADYLKRSHLVNLPWSPEAAPPDYDVVWRCIAKAVFDAICDAVVKDEELRRQFELHSSLQGAAEHGRMLAELHALDARVEASIEQVQVRLGRIEEHQLAESSSSISDAASQRAINLFAEENQELESQLREQLDRKTEELWDRILEHIQKHDFREAIAAGKELSNWLETKASQLSAPVRGRAYLLLAQVALIEVADSLAPDEDYGKARTLFETARNEFGDEVSEENRLRLVDFEAKLLSIDDRDTEALELLGDATDPQSITTKLLIHIDNEDFRSGVDAVRDLPIDKKWCDHALFVYARTGEDSKTHEALAWALSQEDELLTKRCRVAFARATCGRLERDGVLTILSRTTEVENEITEILSVLEPIVNECEGRGRLDSGLEADAIGFAYTLHRLLGKLGKVQSLIDLLHSRRPVHFAYAVAVIRGDAPVDEMVAEHLRTDYPQSFAAHELALGVDSRSRVAPIAIFERIEVAEALARTSEDRASLARLLLQAYTRPGTEPDEEAVNLAIRLVGEQHFLVRLLEAHRVSRSGELTDFEKILNELTDHEDSLIDQFRAQLHIQREEFAKAANFLLKAGRQMAEPDLLKDAAKLALDAQPRQMDTAIRALEDALTICPADADANHMLAFACIQLQGYASAAECFLRLRDLQPNDPIHPLNLAKCYSLANRPDEALSVYDEICDLPEATPHAHVSRALLLVEIGKPIRAFTGLHDIRTEHWDDPAFVAFYMRVAHAANQDRYAHEGFERLWRLREEGKAPPEVLQPKSLDDYVQFVKDANSRRDFLLEQSIKGELPWLFFEDLVGNVPYWGWRIRTQKMPWIFDEARNRASFSIYSTNGYAVLGSETEASFHRIASSAKGGPVVADLSALITLHRLDLLNEGITYFGQVKIPQSYLASVTRHSGKLRPHQLSQQASLKKVQQLIDAKKITIAPGGDDQEELLYWFSVTLSLDVLELAILRMV